MKVQKVQIVQKNKNGKSENYNLQIVNFPHYLNYRRSQILKVQKVLIVQKNRKGDSAYDIQTEIGDYQRDH